MNIKHYEEHNYSLTKEELQRIFYKHFKIETGNYSKIRILDSYNGNEIKFPVQINYEELLEHDSRVAIGLTPAKAKK